MPTGVAFSMSALGGSGLLFHEFLSVYDIYTLVEGRSVLRYQSAVDGVYSAVGRGSADGGYAGGGSLLHCHAVQGCAEHVLFAHVVETDKIGRASCRERV